MIFPGFFFGSGPRPGAEELDRPISNFDIAGIPTGSWGQTGNLFQCYRNIVPSCVLSFFCPCVMWSQIIIRAQIPLLISIKNSLTFCRRNSGYGLFIDYFFWSFAISACLILVLIFFTSLSSYVRIFLSLVTIAILGSLVYFIGHTRTAFREKYMLPALLPADCGVCNMFLDFFIANICLPCALAQMARHVFQYNAWNPPLGLFVRDPTTLPPLEVTLDRPYRADEAGLAWTDNRRVPDFEAAEPRGTSNYNVTTPVVIYSEPRSVVNHPVPTVAVFSNNNSSDVYRPDGSKV